MTAKRLDSGINLYIFEVSAIFEKSEWVIINAGEAIASPADFIEDKLIYLKNSAYRSIKYPSRS